MEGGRGRMGGEREAVVVGARGEGHRREKGKRSVASEAASPPTRRSPFLRCARIHTTHGRPSFLPPPPPLSLAAD